MKDRKELFLKEVIDREAKAKKMAKNVHGRFQEMIRTQGTIEAASKLVISDQISEGLKRLWLNNCLDLSLEQTVLDFPDLFTEEVLKKAKKKLIELNTPK